MAPNVRDACDHSRVNQLNNREIAILILLGIAVIALLFLRPVRQMVPQLLRTLMGKLLIILGLYCGYFVGVLALAHWLGLWEFYLVKDTIIWALFSGLAIFWNFPKASKEPGFFRKSARRAFEVGVFVEFFLNLESLPLVGEIILQLFLVVLGALIAFSQFGKLRTAHRVLQVLLTITGLAVVAWTGVQVVAHWNQISWDQQWRALALPVYLTIAALPAIYLISLYSAYEDIFIHMQVATGESGSQWKARFAIMRGLNFHLNMVGTFTGAWSRKLGRARTYRDARAIVEGFKAARRVVPSDRLRAAREELVSAVLDRSLPVSIEHDAAVPTSRIEFHAVAFTRSDAWEYRLYAASLAHFREIVDGSYGQRYGAGVSIIRSLDKAEASAYLQTKMNELADVSGKFEGALSQSAQEAAFGRPGEPGNPERIVRLAFRLISVYEQFKAIAYDMCGTQVSAATKRALAAASKFPQGPIDQIGEFVDDLAEQAATLPERLEAGEEIDISMTVTLEISDEIVQEFNAALAEAAEDLSE